MKDSLWAKTGGAAWGWFSVLDTPTKLYLVIAGIILIFLIFKALKQYFAISGFNITASPPFVTLRFDRRKKKVQHDPFKEIVSRQLQQVMNLPLLSETHDGESFAFLFPDIFQDPPVQLRKNPDARYEHLHNWIRDHFVSGKNVALIGPSGIGKTTALISLYRTLAETYLTNNSAPLPLFIDLRSLTNIENLGPKELIKFIGQRLNLSDRDLKVLEKTQDSYVLFLDAFDEYVVEPTHEKIQMAIGSRLFNEWFVLSSRSDFYYRYIDKSQIDANLAEVFLLNEWRPEEEISGFLDKYFGKVSRTKKEDIDSFQGFVQTNTLESVVTTPLALTMLLFIWRSENKPDSVPIEDQTGLYSRFIDDWCDKEVRKDKSPFKAADDLKECFKLAAWYMYDMQRDYHNPEKGILLSNLTVKIALKLNLNPTAIAGSRAFHSLLVLVETRRGSFEQFVKAFRHESIQEFLVSQVLLNALVNDDPSLEGALQTVFTYEVNVFVRESLKRNPADHERIANRLAEIYFKNLNTDRLTYEQRTTVRNGAAYYLGRLQSRKTLEIYEMIRSGEIEEHPMVKGTMGSGMILMNEEAGEIDYLMNLADDHPDDIRNRKFHLVYYGDLPDLGPDTYLTDVSNRGVDDWPRTRAALIRRIGSQEERNKRLRTLDLRTFRRLCETRGYSKLTNEEKLAVLSADKGTQNLPLYKRTLIRQEFDQLQRYL